MQTQYDVIVVGAGLSGIGAAYHIQNNCPGKSFVVLEGRSTMGGTWDLFKYPGIRSDSDMYTMGFPFNPWKGTKSLADGPSILQYIKDTAQKFGIDKKIQYNHKVIKASWSDADKMWTLDLAPHETVKSQQLQCTFLMMCSGYYNYTNAYSPHFPASETFKGPIIHPQHWDPTIDYTNKKIILIGSGATAITLAPALAVKAQKVILLQRSPTYVLSLPGEDKLSKLFTFLFPSKLAYQLSRWKNIMNASGFYSASRKWPNTVSRFLRKRIQKELGPEYNMAHFDPNYSPWDQRLCIVPDSDLFRAIKTGKLEIITDTIRCFNPDGLQLDSGQMLEADMIITATGLNIQLLGGMSLFVNGKLLDTSKTHCYRGVMFNDVPNFAISIGYTNASWTLKCNLNCQFTVKLLNFMERKRYAVCTPRFDSKLFGSEPFIHSKAGFIKRAVAVLPKQGSKHPWKVYQNYARDYLSLKLESVNNKHLEFRK